MTSHRLVALLRAVNVGGTGQLPMADLRTRCEDAGFRDVSTYIQSGNLVLSTALDVSKAKRRLEQLVGEALGKPSRVLVRSKPEMESVVARVPFPDAAPSQLLVFFLDDAPPRSALDGVKVPGSERLVLDGRELFIHFPDGQGKSRLRVPFADIGTGRNLNTVRKLVEMA